MLKMKKYLDRISHIILILAWTLLGGASAKYVFGGPGLMEVIGVLCGASIGIFLSEVIITAAVLRRGRFSDGGNNSSFDQIS